MKNSGWTLKTGGVPPATRTSGPETGWACTCPLYICFLAVFMVFFMGCNSGMPSHPEVRAEGEEVRIPVKEVDDGRVHFFTFRGGRKQVNFFIRMDGTGRLHAHFDACYTCYKYRKGYRTEGTEIVCNECGEKFRLAEEVWHDVGGCVPVDLPHTTGNGMIIIKVKDLERGEKLF